MIFMWIKRSDRQNGRRRGGGDNESERERGN